MKLSVKLPNVAKEVRQARAQFSGDLRRAAVIATDRMGRDAQQAVQARIRSVGLGRLANAVGYTSTKRQRTSSADGDPYGAIYARGGDESLAGGALESYSRGATIKANYGQWLAFPTAAIPRRVGRYRTSAILFSLSKQSSTIGKLIFKPLGPNKAVLVIRDVTLSPKTGRAKAAGPRAPRTRIPMKEIVAFILIRVTRRAQRFDKDAEVFQVARRGGDYMLTALAEVQGGGAA